VVPPEHTPIVQVLSVQYEQVPLVQSKLVHSESAEQAFEHMPTPEEVSHLPL